MLAVMDGATGSVIDAVRRAGDRRNRAHLRLRTHARRRDGLVLFLVWPLHWRTGALLRCNMQRSVCNMQRAAWNRRPRGSELSHAGLWENTLVLWTSDNGGIGLGAPPSARPDRREYSSTPASVRPPPTAVSTLVPPLPSACPRPP
jgi:hypothetical protein